MQKTFGKVVYDTNASTLVFKHAVGEFGDPAGYEETLYMTEGGKYFLYTNGGESSIYPKESITRLSVAKAEAWASEHCA